MAKKKTPENHGKLITKKELADIKRLVKEGTPSVEIAKKVGRTLGSLRKIAFDNTISLRVKKAAKKTAKKAAKKTAKKAK
ncbi:hypothetical protein [Dawidia soli]|uniref:Uncharacterized protein n=1 Tax=Dawidia soli TaxID=2782352 RepID=A0AAP2GG85_9BACT|nr:hypothetical protein [Dawidia soli]MBT1690337.1 hypothetical protein [Dawidia soli]